MHPSHPRFVSALLGACILMLANTAKAQLQTPACSLNCTLNILGSAGCDVTSITAISDCLCTSNALQFELTLCVFASCSTADQIVASEILQTELCVGIPHESRKSEILRVEIILAAVTFPMIVLRLISRIWIAKRVWWDDWMIVICALFMIPNTAIPIYTTFIGFGEHIWNVPIQNFTRLTLLYWIASIFYALIQSIAKFSILLLYLRIFPTRSFRLLVKLTLAWQLCHMIAFTLTVVFQCIPVRSFWDLTIARKCMNVNASLKAGAFASILEDFVIMVLPIRELKGLNLGLRKRVDLCFMFALGSFASITSILRLRYVWNYTLSLDGTWDDVDIVIWSDIETYVAVLCSCLMCIRPLLLKIFPALFPSTHAHSSNNKFKTSSTNNSRRQTWGMKIGSALKVSKIWNLDTNSTQMTRLDDERGVQSESESARTIIIQGNNGSERSLQGIEMEERGYSPSTMGRTISEGQVRSVEYIGAHGEGRR